MERKQEKQCNFPLIEKYREVFSITPHTIFAYKNTIYSDDDLPEHLWTHELTHLKQQNEIGLDKWVRLYLTDPEFRLKIEVAAYRKQLESIKDREFRLKIRMESAQNLSSSLYGNIINYEQALKLLWMK